MTQWWMGTIVCVSTLLSATPVESVCALYLWEEVSSWLSLWELVYGFWSHRQSCECGSLAPQWPPTPGLCSTKKHLSLCVSVVRLHSTDGVWFNHSWFEPSHYCSLDIIIVLCVHVLQETRGSCDIEIYRFQSEVPLLGRIRSVHLQVLVLSNSLQMNLWYHSKSILYRKWVLFQVLALM